MKPKKSRKHPLTDHPKLNQLFARMMRDADPDYMKGFKTAALENWWAAYQDLTPKSLWNDLNKILKGSRNLHWSKTDNFFREIIENTDKLAVMKAMRDSQYVPANIGQKIKKYCAMTKRN